MAMYKFNQLFYISDSIYNINGMQLEHRYSDNIFNFHFVCSHVSSTFIRQYI